MVILQEDNEISLAKIMCGSVFGCVCVCHLACMCVYILTCVCVCAYVCVDVPKSPQSGALYCPNINGMSIKQIKTSCDKLKPFFFSFFTVGDKELTDMFSVL